MDERRLELKVGAMAAIALAIAAALLAALGHFGAGSRYALHVDFAYAGGLPQGAVVKIAGVKVGRVRDVAFRPDGRDEQGRVMPVRLTLDIDRYAAQALREDAVATVATQGALGESYVEVVPGQIGSPLAEGSVIRGIDPPRLDIVLARLFSVLEGAVNDEAFRQFLVSVAHLADTIDAFIVNHRAELGGALENVIALIADGREAMGEVRGITRNAQALVSSPELKTAVHDVAALAAAARKDLVPLIEETRSIVARVDQATDGLGPEDVARLKATLARYETLGGRLDKAAASVETILAHVEKGEGTLGKLYQDPKVYDDLRALLSDVKAHPWKLVWKK